jgi:poly(A) polymerase
VKEKKILDNGLRIISKTKTGRCYVVGGYIRNKLMGLESLDVDLVVDNVEAARNFADAIRGSYFVLGAGLLHRVIKDSIKWDFVKLEDDIYKDLAKRDFTINSIAVELNDIFKDDISKYLIDPSNGLKDIEAGIIRPVSDEIFIDDHIRILRAYRLKAELEFDFAEGMQPLVDDSAVRLKEEKGERIFQELEKIFSGKNNGNTLKELDKYGIFKNIYPGPRDSTELNKILDRSKDIDLPEPYNFLLCIAAVWDNEEIGERLKLSGFYKKVLRAYNSLDKDIFECWLKYNENAKNIFNGRYIISGDKEFLEIIKEYDKNIKMPCESLISGDEVMKIRNIGPSSEVGLILKKVLREQFEGILKSADEAVRFVENYND